MVSVEYSEAVVEVLGILYELEDEDFNKIPKNVIDFFEKNKSITYDPNIDYTENVEKLVLRDKTREILAGIYLDYFCPEEEKFEYKKTIRKNRCNYEESLKENFSGQEIFKIRKKETSNEMIVVKKETFFEKFLYKIKRWFNKHF